MPSGVGKGHPLKLRAWQKEEIRAIFDPVDGETGHRRVRRALLSFARKNGKSALAAALLLCALCGPLAQVNGEVYSAATTKDQAALIYKMASQMIKLSAELSEHCTCLDTTKRIVVPSLNAFYQSLAAEAGAVHGQNSHFIIYDELAQAKSRDLYDAIVTSFGAQENALLLVISTQSSDPLSVMSELVDDAIAQANGMLDDPTFYGRVFAVPDDADIYDERNWYLANPALGDFKVLAHVRSLAEKARRSPAQEAAFRQLELNQRVDGSHAFVNSVDWKACAGSIAEEKLADATWHGGLDLSGRRDLTSLVLAAEIEDAIAIEAYFWTPAERLEDRSKLDGAQYPVWRDKGLLRVVPGPMVDYERVAADISEICKIRRIAEIGYDRWNIQHLAKHLDGAVLAKDLEKSKAGKLIVPPGRVVLRDWGQGFKDMSPALETLEEIILNHAGRHGGNPLLTYCLANVKVQLDPAGNRKFDKRQTNRRIDGAVAMAISVACLKRPLDLEARGPSVYESRGALAF